MKCEFKNGADLKKRMPSKNDPTIYSFLQSYRKMIMKNWLTPTLPSIEKNADEKRARGIDHVVSFIGDRQIAWASCLFVIYWRRGRGRGFLITYASFFCDGILLNVARGRATTGLGVIPM